MDIGWPEILLILVVVLLLFGPGRIGKVAGELGQGIRNFRQNLDGTEKADEAKKDAEKSADGADSPKPPDQSK
jgi:twin arginine-targeting protein translocase, TatA/E family